MKSEILSIFYPSGVSSMIVQLPYSQNARITQVNIIDYNNGGTQYPPFTILNLGSILNYAGMRVGNPSHPGDIWLPSPSRNSNILSFVLENPVDLPSYFEIKWTQSNNTPLTTSSVIILELFYETVTSHKLN